MCKKKIFYFLIIYSLGIAQELSTIIENSDIKNRLDILSKNYENFDELWPLEKLNQFVGKNKQAIIKKIPESKRMQRQRRSNDEKR